MRPEDPFSIFFRDEYPAVIRVAYLVVGDREDARDIAQEAFAQLFSRWKRISEYQRPDAWVRRVAIRMAVRRVRRERLRPQLEREVDVSHSTGPLDLDVLRAVGQLPAGQRAAVVLFYLEDRPIAEVADIMRCSEVTAKVHLHRARKRLAQTLEGSEMPKDFRYAP